MIIKDIAEIIGAGYNAEMQSEDIKILLTDSRNHFNPEDTLFFAIRTIGGNDGHNYIGLLFEKGVRNFVVEYVPEEFKDLKANFMIVENSVEALTKLGRANRRNAKEIVAITGSRGKTTVKELIFQMMEPYKRISRSPRSYNSKIGVPLSLWQISPDSDIAIIEAGISQKGEMWHQSMAIEPDTVILTNIGEAHSNGFSSLEEKTIEKVLLAKGESVATVIYPFDNALIRKELSSLSEKKEKIGWSEKDTEAELFIRKKNRTGIKEGKEETTDRRKKEGLEKIEYVWKGEKGQIEVKLEKEYDFENIASTIAFMLKEGVAQEEIEERFKNLRRISTRMNVSEGVNGCSVILDSYTSDLSSLQPAIDFMNRRKMPWQTLTLIVSDLHHEGQSSEATYQEMARIIEATGIKKLIGIGKSIQKYSSMFHTDSRFYATTSAFLNEFSASDFNDEIILLKGSAEYDFRKIYEQLEAKKHETVLEVNLDALLRNYNYFRSHVPSSTGIITMVKAQGYGAGSYEVAKTLQDAGAAYLAVAALDEGIDLRKNGIVMPVMVMNPRAANYRALFKNRLEPVIYSMSMLQRLIEEAGKYGEGEYPVHIKLDTGMHRMGFMEGEIERLVTLLSSSTNIKVASIFSHLATADCLDMDNYTIRQLERFETMSSKIMGSLNYYVKRHILNSAGIIRFPQYHYDLVRLGIGLYGANTLPPEIEKTLSPVSTLRSVIISIREITGDEAVGYSRKGKINCQTRVATIPIGYADGINRKFGNGAIKVMLNGTPVPTIGNICMDAMMIDVTGVECREGDSVEIFGENISLQSLADTLDTIPYEILTSISPRVKRVYYRE